MRKDLGMGLYQWKNNTVVYYLQNRQFHITLLNKIIYEFSIPESNQN